MTVTYTRLRSEEIARRGTAWYESSIRAKVEIPENIGKMIIIDVETGDYEVEEPGIDASHHMHEKRPNAALYGIRIGYNVVESFGGVIERIAR